jgi:hypothetical protein
LVFTKTAIDDNRRCLLSPERNAVGGISSHYTSSSYVHYLSDYSDFYIFITLSDGTLRWQAPEMMGGNHNHLLALRFWTKAPCHGSVMATLLSFISRHVCIVFPYFISANWLTFSEENKRPNLFQQPHVDLSYSRMSGSVTRL